MALGKAFRERMKLMGIGNKELSELSGVPLRTVGNILNDVTDNPGIRTVQLMAHALGCTVDDIIEEAEGYYIDEAAAAYAQELFDNPELRILMDASRDVTKEDLEFITQMVMKLKQNKND